MVGMALKTAVQEEGLQHKRALGRLGDAAVSREDI